MATESSHLRISVFFSEEQGLLHELHSGHDPLKMEGQLRLAISNSPTKPSMFVGMYGLKTTASKFEKHFEKEWRGFWVQIFFTPYQKQNSKLFKQDKCRNSSQKLKGVRFLQSAFFFKFNFLKTYVSNWCGFFPRALKFLRQVSVYGRLTILMNNLTSVPSLVRTMLSTCNFPTIMKQGLQKIFGHCNFWSVNAGRL